MYRSNHQRLWCFQAALDDLADKTRDERTLGDEARAASFRSRSLKVSPPLSGIIVQAPCTASLNHISRLYATSVMTGPRGASEKETSLDDPIPRLSPEMTEAELISIRRAFALRNHPDRVPHHLRARADRKMAMVNALVDKAIRGKNF